MSCVHTFRPDGIATSRALPALVQQGCEAACVALLACVALTPRSSGAQATAAHAVSVRHTLQATVPAVTRVDLLSLVRADARTLRERYRTLSPAASARAWSATASLRSNVPVVLYLAPRQPSLTGGDEWYVLNAEQELVRWGDTPIAVSATQAPGMHQLEVVLVAPSGAPTPPTVSLSLQPHHEP
jgi:hypothetical protein